MNSIIEKYLKVILAVSVVLNLVLGFLLYINQTGKYTITKYEDEIILLNTQSGETFISDIYGNWELSHGFGITKGTLDNNKIEQSVDSVAVDSASVSDTIDFKDAIVK